MGAKPRKPRAGGDSRAQDKRPNARGGFISAEGRRKPQARHIARHRRVAITGFLSVGNGGASRKACRRFTRGDSLWCCDCVRGSDAEFKRRTEGRLANWFVGRRKNNGAILDTRG